MDERDKIKKIQETKQLFSQQLVQKKNETKEEFELRKKVFKKNQIERFKEILLQDVSKNGSNRSFMKYTKDLIKTYLLKPYSYRNEITEVSRYLYRICTVYKKIILYYATLPEYNYNIIPKIDLDKKYSFDMKEYTNILKIMQNVDMVKEFSTAIALAIRDGLYCSFVYQQEDGLFFHILDPKYLKICGKNERGLWQVYMDCSYFSVGSNSEFVESAEGHWDQVFVDAWKLYQIDSRKYRWFMLPPEKTITLLANLDDEFDIPLPWYCGLFISLIDLLDFEQIIADKNELENFVLLLSKIPLIDSDVVDDFKISIEMVQAMQELIDEVVPNLVGTAYSPMSLEVVSFADAVNNTDQTDKLNDSISRIFTQAGPPSLVVSGGTSTNSVGLKYSLIADSSLVFNLWLNRLEFNFQYYIDKNINDKYIFKFHKESAYLHDDYVDEKRELATLGGSAIDLLTASGDTPYEALCKVEFENAFGIKLRMTPLQSSYNTSNKPGRPQSDDSDLSEEGQKTRDGDKNVGTAIEN